MVSELIRGETIDELLEKGVMKYQLLLELFHIHGFYLFCIGTFHGDIHPGNILVKDGNLYFLDTGAISTVGEKMRKGLFGFFDALSSYDYEKSAHALNKMAEREIEGKAYERFRKQFLELYADFTDSTVSQVSLTRRMMETIKLGVNSGMVFEKGMYPIIKSLMYLDGMVLRCNPGAVLMRDVRNFVGQFRDAVYGGAGGKLE
jgi:ubiquinone biosynthesis protein